MVKKILVSLGIILLIAVIGISAYIVLQGGKNLAPISNNQAQQTTQQTAITIQPQALTVQPNQLSTLQVMIQNAKSTPAIVQLELTYDPTVLSDVTIVPGTFFAQPEILFSRINQSTGRISYVLQASNENSPLTTTAPVAIISFVPSSYAAVSQTEISFLPKSAVKDVNNTNILNGMYGATLTLSTFNANTFPTPTIETALPTLPFQPTIAPNPLSPTPTLSY